jgi:peptide chain release factor subunit 1
MQAFDLDRDRLRALAATRPDHGRVLSLYLNLDPREFATPPARQTAITSLLTDAGRAVEAAGCDHDGERALRADLERARELLRGDPPTEGAHGLALFLSEPAGLFEVVRLPRPVPARASVAAAPVVAPLAGLLDDTDWVVLLANRRVARILRGTRDGLDEVADEADSVHGQHREGGLSEPRYERSVEHEVDEHLRSAAEGLFDQFKRRRFDALLLGAPDEVAGRMEEQLHPYLRERLAGRVSVDVEAAGADDVLAAAREAMAAHERQRLQARLGRLREGVAAGRRGASGWEDVLSALNERRVETLLLSADATPGVRCPACGWLGTEASACPVDGTPVEALDDAVEAAVEAALGQGAEVARVEEEDLAGLGGVAAVLRF